MLHLWQAVGALAHFRVISAHQLDDTCHISITPADLPNDVAAVGAGHYSSFAATSHGQLWSWGRSSEGQLGRATAPDEFGCSATPQPVDALHRQQVCGRGAEGAAARASFIGSFSCVLGHAAAGGRPAAAAGEGGRRCC